MPSRSVPATGLTPQAYRAALDAYRKLNDSPMQRKLRKQHPAHIGVVYWTRNEVSRRTLLRELRRMKDVGFTFVRYHTITPQETAAGKYDFSKADMWMDAAHEAGLGVYPHIGLNKPDSRALEKAGIASDEADRWSAADPRVRECIRPRVHAIVGRYRHHPALWAWPMQGEPSATAIPLADETDRENFLTWLKNHYATPRALHAAWSIYPDSDPPLLASWHDAVALAAKIRQTHGHALSTTGLRHEMYGAIRDLVRFRADRMLEGARAEIEMIREADPDHPVALGNHQLFINNAQLGWDILSSGRLADIHFSSIHLSWHFEQSQGEVDRPVYAQARFTHDAHKGGASNAYETTGGPVQYSGGYGNHMDAGLMRRLMLLYLAAGNQGIAFWDWICRPGGIESGEYGMVTLSGAVSEWARDAGRVARAMARHAAEIWESWEPPELGIVRSWDTEAVLAVEPERFELAEGPSDFSRGTRQQHMRALLGATRAAVDAQVAFEYLTPDEILKGITGVYPAIYLPHVRACSDELLEALLRYVQGGGRLLADVQIGFQDPWGKVRLRGRGRILDRSFGAWVDQIHDARTRPQRVDDAEVRGFDGNLVTTRARVIRRFASGRPALSEARIGRGRAILAAFDPARECWLPGNAPMQAILADLYRGDAPRRWWSDAPMAFRRSGKAADHWFFVNDGPARTAVLRVYDRTYRSGLDVLTGKAIPVEGTIALDLPAMSALWLRMER
jgi:beta-galactosidase